MSRLEELILYRTKQLLHGFYRRDYDEVRMGKDTDKLLFCTREK